MCSNVSEQLVRRLQGSDDYQWADIDAQGRSGGIICILDRNFINNVLITKRERWVRIRGMIQETRLEWGDWYCIWVS